MGKVKAKLKNKHVTTLSFANVAFDVVDGIVEIPEKYITDEFKHLFEEVLKAETKKEAVTDSVEEIQEEKPKKEKKTKE